ncbi:MAG: hypothetical protein AAGG53_16805, partial [Cyanobacteria bacterium P01_H01_bin.152]
EFRIPNSALRTPHSEFRIRLYQRGQSIQPEFDEGYGSLLRCLRIPMAQWRSPDSMPPLF